MKLPTSTPWRHIVAIPRNHASRAIFFLGCLSLPDPYFCSPPRPDPIHPHFSPPVPVLPGRRRPRPISSPLTHARSHQPTPPFISSRLVAAGAVVSRVDSRALPRRMSSAICDGRQRAPRELLAFFDFQNLPVSLHKLDTLQPPALFDYVVPPLPRR